MKISQQSIHEACKALEGMLLNKNEAYGPSLEESLDEFGLPAALIRMQDKLNRLKQTGASDSEDALSDLAGYALLSSIWAYGIAPAADGAAPPAEEATGFLEGGCREIFKHYTLKPQLKKLMEEAYELAVAASDVDAGAVLEELADLRVMEEQIRLAFGLAQSDIAAVMEAKVRRTLERIGAAHDSV